MPSVSISKSNINERSTTNHTSSNQNESPLLKVIVVVWREYPTASKEKTCPNMKKINQSDMSQQKCALTWSCLDVSWHLYDQSQMKGLCPSIRPSLKWLNSAACSHKCQCLDPIIANICQQWWEGYAPINTSNQITQSYLIPQCERNLITSKEQLYLKNHRRLRNMPLCKVHQMKYTYHVSCSNVKNDVWSPLKGGHNSKIHHRLREVCLGIMAI